MIFTNLTKVSREQTDHISTHLSLDYRAETYLTVLERKCQDSKTASIRLNSREHIMKEASNECDKRDKSKQQYQIEPRPSSAS